MLHKTRGVVLRTIKYAESSIICKIYTEEFGWQSYIVNSVRSAKSKSKANLYRPLSLLDLVVYKNERKDIQRISEAKYTHIYTSIPFEVVKSSIALFLAEVILKAVQEEERNKELFQFIFNSLCLLDETEDSVANFPLYFLIKLTKYLGFYPSGSYSEQNNAFNLHSGSFQPYAHSVNSISIMLSELLSKLMQLSVQEIKFFSVPALYRKELLNKVLIYYQLHLGGFNNIKSPDILEAVFKE